MYSLLFINKIGNEAIPRTVFTDLGMDKVFDKSTIEILSRECSVLEIYSRQQIFKMLDDNCFRENMYKFYLAIKSFVLAKNRLQTQSCQLGYIYSFFNYAREYKKILELSLLITCNENKLIKNLQEKLGPIVSFLPRLSEIVDESVMLLSVFSKKVINPYNREICDHFDGIFLQKRLLHIADIMKINVESKCRSISKSVPKWLGDKILSSEENTLDKLYELFDDIKPFIDEGITSLIADLDFYFKVYALKQKARNLEINSCLPKISETPCLQTQNMYDITLMEIKQKNIVPNDAVFDEENKFYVLTGANSGGKTSYLRACAVNLLLFKAGCPVFCSSAKIYPFAQIFTHFCSDDTNTKDGSFYDEYSSLQEKVAQAVDLREDAIFFMNEPFSTTGEMKAENSIYEIANMLFDSNCFGLLVTHFHQVANKKFPALHVAVDAGDDNIRTYKIVRGSEQWSYARDILRKYHLDKESLKDGGMNG